MSHFLQIFVLVVYAILVLVTTNSMVRAILWARKEENEKVVLMPRKWDWAYLVAIMIGNYLGIKIYHYWGWSILEAVTYYSFIPMVLFSFFNWMNRSLVASYRLTQFARGNYPALVRLYFWIVKVRQARVNIEVK